ncbi:MAG: C40 family peptidase [Chlorobi bacterium]|nr:MAG: sprproduct [Chlorobi bacterium OLB7]MBK8909812.1 C40 family peptidase [Chlorobiota bacterium]MBX7215567.1 C40 family peptidase [Candidatus Kapabacteria bacterium]
MTRILQRLAILASLAAMLLALAPAAGDGTAAYAKARKPAAKISKGKKSAKIAKATKSKRGRYGKKSRRYHRRTYTLRGNPEVTRRVASQLLMEKVPELAALVSMPVTPEAAAPVPVQAPAQPIQTDLSSGLRYVTGTAYQDSELDEQEDPDGISEEDEEDLEEIPDDINYFYKEFTTYMASLNGSGESLVTYNGADKQTLMETLVDWLGTRYLFGGVTRTGIDCSAFTGMMYRSLNYKLPRTAAMQWGVGLPVDRTDLQFGDLVFFNTRSAVYVSHVGMYLGNGMFAHASSRNGVTVSSLEADYYNSHFIGARRYDFNSVATTASLGTNGNSLQ